MTLSIDVLPAPFGPMIARISPLRMSKETLLTALTPPNESETFSTARSTSPTATSGPPTALMAVTRALEIAERTPRRSCRLLQRGGRAHGRHIADLHARLDHTFASVLERNLGGDVGFLRAVIERRDQG